MSSRSVATLDRLFATLRRRRYAVYAGGLAAVVLTSLGLPAWTRTPLVVGALTLMGTTYLAELHGRSDDVRPEVAVTAVAIAGVVVGAFVLTEVSRLAGLLFLLGGLLFFRAAVQRSQA